MAESIVETITRIRTNPSKADVAGLLTETLHFIQCSYYLWTAAYWILGVLALALPALAAMGAFEGGDGRINRILAGCGALAGGVFGFGKVSENTNNYDAATQLAWKVQCWFACGKIDSLQAADMLGQCMDIMKGSYSAIMAHPPGNP